MKVHRSGLSLVEVLLASSIFVLAMIPLIELLTTTSRGTKLTADHLIAQNLAQMAFEQVASHATLDNADSFDEAMQLFNRTGNQSAPNGCPGVAIHDLAGPGEVLMPQDGKPELDMSSTQVPLGRAMSRFSASIAIAPASQAASAVTTTGPNGPRATLARVDVEVHWKNERGECRSIKLSDYVVRRKY